MSLSITRPVYQIRSVAGVARAGWMLRFFQINSDVEKEVYEDIDRTVPACQPVILNSEGWACLYAGDGDYTVREYDADGVLKDCFNLPGAGGSAGGTFSIVPTMQAMRELAAGSSTYVVSQGYSEYGDGCGGEFDWIPDAANADDGVVWFAPVSFPATGRYRRRNATALTMRMAGDTGSLSSSYETFTRIIGAAESGDVIVIPPGTYRLTGSEEIDIPALISVQMESGAKIQTSGASQVNIAGTFSAPVEQVFTGELSIAFGSRQPVAYPEWFGALGSGVGDDTAAFLSLFSSGARLISLPSRLGYRVETDVSASIPALAVFSSASNLVYATGPVTLIFAGIYCKSGRVKFANGDFQIITADSVNAADVNVSGNVNAEAVFANLGLNTNGDVTANGAVNGASLSISGNAIVQDLNADDIAATGNLNVTGNVVSGQQIESGSFVQAVSGPRIFKASGNLFDPIVGTSNANIEGGTLFQNNDRAHLIVMGNANGSGSKSINFTLQGISIVVFGTPTINNGDPIRVEIDIVRTSPSQARVYSFITVKNSVYYSDVYIDVVAINWLADATFTTAPTGGFTQVAILGTIYPV